MLSLSSALSSMSDGDCFLFVGSDIKKEIPLLHARLRSMFLRDSSAFATFGSECDSEGFPKISLGLSISEFCSFLKGNHSFCKKYSSFKNPKILISSKLLKHFKKSEIDTLLS